MTFNRDMDMQLQYSKYKYFTPLLLFRLLSLYHYVIFSYSVQGFFPHTFVNIQAIAKDQRDLICGQLLIFV